MESFSKFGCFLALMLYLAVSVNSAGMPNFKLKLNALETLLRSEMYLVNEKLDIGRSERQSLFDKFEETMGYLEKWSKAENNTLTNYRTGQDQMDFNTLLNEIEKLVNRFEGNTKDIDELSDSLIRIKRGVREEKVARKSNTDGIIKLLEVVQKNQNETKKVQEESVTNIISNQNNYQIEMKKSYNEIVSTINSVVSNQNNILNKLEEIVAVQSNLMKKVNDIPSKDSVRELDIKLDKYYNMTEQIGTQITEVMSSTHNLESNINIKLDKYSSMTEQIGTQITEVMSSTYNLESNINMISDNIDNVRVNIEDLYSKNRGAFEKLFEVQQHLINVLIPVNLVGGDVPFEGTVIVKYGETLGTVCDDGWDDKDATVVCRVLGYTGGTAYHHAKFGEGTGDILLDDVHCTGGEKSLFDCPHAGIRVHDCHHTEDAGVRCHDSQTIPVEV